MNKLETEFASKANVSASVQLVAQSMEADGRTEE